MTDDNLPAPHPVAEVDAHRPYITLVVMALGAQGVRAERSWMDPMGPIDATIVLPGSIALVWDEWTGWNIGTYESGRQGERTVLRDKVKLAADAKTAAADVATMALAELAASFQFACV